MSKELRFLVSGWYGYRNIGDEVILSAIKSSLEKEFLKCEVSALSNNPAFTKSYNKCKSARHLPYGLKAWAISIIKLRLFITLVMFMKCDVLLIGGGGFLSDWQPEAPWIWLRQAILAKLLRKKVMLYGIGAGPIRSKKGKKLTSFIINNFVDKVTVRDETSYRALIESGVNEDIVFVTEDPVFSIKYKQRYNDCIKKIGISAAPIYINEKLWSDSRNKYEGYIKSMRELVIRLTEDYDCVFIPMQEIDLKVYNDIQSNGKIEKFESVEIKEDLNNGIRAIADIDLLIGMRLHAGIISSLHNNLVIPIVYHHKVYEFSKKIEMEDCMLEVGDGNNWVCSDINIDLALKKLKEIELRIKDKKKRLDENIKILRDKETKNIILLKELIKI